MPTEQEQNAPQADEERVDPPEQDNGIEEEVEVPDEQEQPRWESLDEGEPIVMATNLNVPWEITPFDGDIYVSERTGSITKVTEDGSARKAVHLEKSLADNAEAGLLGLAFPASFTEDEHAIAYYSYVDGGAVYQRIARIQEQENQWIETEVLLDEIPGGRVHQGGRLEIGPDGYLYATTGDAASPHLAQDPASLAGKILRLQLDGSVPDDNPFPDSYVYSYGHRNPQGLSWDEDGNLYATEHGNQAHDEINKIEAGKNYGWPVIEGDEQSDEMESPIVHSGNDTWAPSGMSFYNGNFYFASLRGEAVREYNVSDQTQQVVLDGYGRIRDVLAADVGLYFITNNTDGRGNPSQQDDQLMLWKK